ncbi:S1 RNA-binding domain-containing protein [Streptomyces rubiginosohelvolus]|uniref:S1 RNA-binding domain-containing protein n=1 Tax=Streptomyces rubiginosohelvolus TaxID=67362 RepID=UPI0036CD3320
MHADELDESSGDVVEVGDTLTVKIIDVDLECRRIVLSHVQALGSPADGSPGD